MNRYSIVTLIILCLTWNSYAQTEYHYDLSGNRNRVLDQFFYPTDQVILLDFQPKKGLPGDSVRIFGRGFNEVSSDNKVAFKTASEGSVSGEILKVDSKYLLVRVPEGAVTGKITVTNTDNGLSDSTVEDFLVQGVRITPPSGQIMVGESFLFNSEVIGIPDQTVNWFVDDVQGGNDEVGDISTDGLYSHHSPLPGRENGKYLETFEIRGVSASAPYLWDSARVTVVDLIHSPSGPDGQMPFFSHTVSYINHFQSTQSDMIFRSDTVSYVNYYNNASGDMIFTSKPVSYKNQTE